MSQPGTALRHLFVLAIAASSWLLNSQAHAVTTNWNTNSDGTFTNAANWDNGVPDSDDTAVFDRGFVAYTVTFPGSPLNPPPDYVIDRLRLRTNEVTFADDNSPFLKRPSVTVANVNPSFYSIILGDESGDPAILNMTLRRLSGNGIALIGVFTSAIGTLNVSSGTFSMTGDIWVGGYGVGALNISAGGRVEDSIGVIGYGGEFTEQLGSAAATVTGAGSTWANSGDLYVGDTWNDGNSLTIADGGSVSSENGWVRHIATATVTGPASSWSNRANLYVGGQQGFTQLQGATLNIRNGAVVSSVAGYVGGSSRGYGLVTVADVGSTWTNTGDLTLGDDTFWTGTLLVSDGGNVTVGGQLSVESSGVVGGNGTITGFIVNRGTVSPSYDSAPPGALHVNGDYVQSPTGRLEIRLGGTTAGTQYDQLQVNGNVTLNGLLEVALANSFVPSAGNAFDIIDWTNRSGNFAAIQLPSLAAGLTWNTSQLYTTGTLSVVSMPLPGDYNNNGTVDAADYVLWRKSPSNFGGNPGGYNSWRVHFGQTAGSGSALPSADPLSAVPEPAGAFLLLIFGAAIGIRRGSRVATRVPSTR